MRRAIKMLIPANMLRLASLNYGLMWKVIQKSWKDSIEEVPNREKKIVFSETIGVRGIYTLS